MVLLRRIRDYARFNLLLRRRAFASLLGLIVGVGILSTRLFIGPSDTLSIFLFLCSGVVLASSAYFLCIDFRSWLSARQDIIFDEDEYFVKNASALKPEENGAIEITNDYVYTTYPGINRSINFVYPKIAMRTTSYEIPLAIASYQEHAVKRRNPTHNEEKVRLLTDMTIDSIATEKTIYIQRTDYFRGVATNEIAKDVIFYSNRSESRREHVCSIFDNYVKNRENLVPLSRSSLSNHIGVTSVVISGDDQIVLQWQGQTQVDKNKINVGASGSVDWNDVKVFEKAQERKGFFGMIAYAMEREAAEEISAVVAPGQAHTILTGYSRYIHRGGKPEFFGLTFIRTSHADLRVRQQEAKWVKGLEFRPLADRTPHGIMTSLQKVLDEHSPSKTQKASISMLLALRFATEFAKLFPNELSKVSQ